MEARPRARRRLRGFAPAAAAAARRARPAPERATAPSAARSRLPPLELRRAQVEEGAQHVAVCPRPGVPRSHAAPALRARAGEEMGKCMESTRAGAGGTAGVSGRATGSSARGVGRGSPRRAGAAPTATLQSAPQSRILIVASSRRCASASASCSTGRAEAIASMSARAATMSTRLLSILPESCACARGAGGRAAPGGGTAAVSAPQLARRGWHRAARIEARGERAWPRSGAPQWTPPSRPRRSPARVRRGGPAPLAYGAAPASLLPSSHPAAQPTASSAQLLGWIGEHRRGPRLSVLRCPRFDTDNYAPGERPGLRMGQSEPTPAPMI